LQQEDFMLPTSECPEVSWMETDPYIRPAQYTTAVDSESRFRKWIEEYWQLAYNVNIGFNPQLIMSKSPAYPIRVKQSDQNKDCCSSINWGRLREHLAAATHNISTGRADGLAESTTCYHSLKQSLDTVDPSFLDD
jgi:hypothetical protein